MSREHKYKAWDMNKKIMIHDGDLYHPYKLTKEELRKKVYPCRVTSHGILFTNQVSQEYNDDYVELTKDGKHQTYYSSWEYEQLCLDNIKLLEYVGFNDKNDKEIYEGDIDSGGYVVTYLANLQGGLGMNAGWYLQRDNFESWSELECNDYVEIVGNIFENLEKAINNCNTDYTILF